MGHHTSVTIIFVVILALAWSAEAKHAAVRTQRLSPSSGRGFMGAQRWVHKQTGSGAPSEHPELAPYFHVKKENRSSNSSAVAALQIGEESCSTGPKTGYWLVGCYQHKGVDPNRVYYDHFIPTEDRQEMTPFVCFEFCKIQYGMRFFFLGEPGNDARGLCSCGRFYHKSSGKGGLGSCDRECPGDASCMCGGLNKESIYQMHDCRAAEALPSNPWEVRGIRVEIAGSKGVKFWSGSDAVPTIGSPNASKVADHPDDLLIVTLDPHDGFLKNVEHFNIEGLLADGTNDETFATQESQRVDTWVQANTITNDVIMVAFNSRSNTRNVIWGAPVEKALRESGCPLVKKPMENFGYAAICGGKTEAPQSPSQPTGHVSGYIYNSGTVGGRGQVRNRLCNFPVLGGCRRLFRQLWRWSGQPAASS